MMNFTLPLLILIAACIPAAAVSAQHDVEQATQDATQATAEIVEKATADVAEKAAVKAVKKVVEKAAADTAAKDELKAKRPEGVAFPVVFLLLLGWFFFS